MVILTPSRPRGLPHGRGPIVVEKSAMNPFPIAATCSMAVSVSFRIFDIKAIVAKVGVAVWTKFSISVRRLELRIAESVFGAEGMGCRLTSWIALRSALGISMIAIYLPTTWVMCLGRRIETQGEVGSRCRDGRE